MQMRRLRILFSALALMMTVFVVGLGMAGESPAAAAGLDCGPTVLKPDGTPWTCTFDDEFNGTSLDSSKWVPQTVFVTGDPDGAYACYARPDSDIAVGGGALHLSVHHRWGTTWCPGGLRRSHYDAGMVSTYHRFSQEYGRFEARIRSSATTTPGLNEEFWMVPDDQYSTIEWPESGEIDISQQFSNQPYYSVPYLHYTSDDNGGPLLGLNAGLCFAQRGVWNTYDMVWTPTSITISVNGTECLHNTSADAAFNKRYIIDLTQALGTGGDSLTKNSILPATMDVDYVRAWR